MAVGGLGILFLSLGQSTRLVNDNFSDIRSPSCSFRRPCVSRLCFKYLHSFINLLNGDFNLILFGAVSGSLSWKISMPGFEILPVFLQSQRR